MSRQTLTTAHEGCIHDVQMNYNGRYLATAGSDGRVKIFEVKGGEDVELANIRAHDGGVWQVSWCHSRASGGAKMLASAGEDGRVCIWKESGKNWECIHTVDHIHEGGAVAISWSPFEFGAILSSAGADGIVAVCTRSNEGWTTTQFIAHSGGVTGISWAPFLSSCSLVRPIPLQNLASLMRFVTCGCDGHLVIWKYTQSLMKWESIQVLSDHCRNGVVAIRDVQWAKNCGLPFDYIASCADDKAVIVWTQEAPEKNWTHRIVVRSNETPCRVSWSLTGSLLAVSFENRTVSMWKEERSGEWAEVSRIS
eukprot:TRINITY_DN13912_c0_g1_i1.p1 TRINITY_DN13912_c0_g1~~TRINITY_DN13912_c0_g1_i1.p1  ORF type:complete len:309 (+),score=35.48 TRINITY_DN13912_c0_g1_i1:127-1053(+)